MKAKIGLMAIGLALLLGCGRYFAPEINLQRYLTEYDVMGTWTLTTNTMVLARRGGYVPAAGSVHQIVFESNGICRFSSIDEFGAKVEYLEGVGRWKLTHDTELRADSKVPKNRLELEINGTNGPHATSFAFTEEGKTIYLWKFWGDPDAWEFMKYEKRR